MVPAETEGAGGTRRGWREFGGSSLRGAEYDPTPSGQTWFEDLHRELRKLGASDSTEVAGELQSEAERARRFHRSGLRKFGNFRL